MHTISTLASVLDFSTNNRLKNLQNSQVGGSFGHRSHLSPYPPINDMTSKQRYDIRPTADSTAYIILKAYYME